MIKIHNFSRGARGLRLVWQCEEMGLPYELVTVSYPPSDAYLALNPMGSVPFLEDDGGVAINESIAIMLYLATQYGPTPLLPSTKDEPQRLARVLQMTTFSEATFGSGLNTLLAAHFAAPDEAAKRNWSVLGLEGRLDQALQFIVTVLGDRPFLAGADFSLADIAISTSLGVYRGALGKALPAALVAYRERLATRPAYERATKAARANAEK